MNPSSSNPYAATRDHRGMILHPLHWPHVSLPLIRSVVDYPEANDAVFCPPLGATEISETEPITLRIGNIFMMEKDAPTITYENVDALLRDGWQVD